MLLSAVALWVPRFQLSGTAAGMNLQVFALPVLTGNPIEMLTYPQVFPSNSWSLCANMLEKIFLGNALLKKDQLENYA